MLRQISVLVATLVATSTIANAQTVDCGDVPQVLINLAIAGREMRIEKALAEVPPNINEARTLASELPAATTAKWELVLLTLEENGEEEGRKFLAKMWQGACAAATCEEARKIVDGAAKYLTTKHQIAVPVCPPLKKGEK